MKRRNFVKGSAMITGLGLSGFAMLNACYPKKEEANQDESSGANQVASFRFEEVTVEELQRMMKSGEATARSIAEAYISRIEALDKSGPELNSVIELNPDALTIADTLDEERKNNKVRGPLHGIPILIKDNIDTGDKMMTTAGSLALEGHKAVKDAFIITQLREAGAVLLGKTNLSEWANFRSTRSSSGWSSRGGQTKNPYVPHRSPCGSSAGSGTAVSANLCAISIGTETNGSIACPSSVNGIVGIKPTVGLWSRSGIIPISHTQDTAGPMARTVRDAAILLGALTAIDEQDPVTKQRSREVPSDYTTFLKDDFLQGKNIGVEKSLMKGHEAIDALLQQALDQMKSKGANIVPVDLLSGGSHLDGDEYEVLKYEFKDGLNKYLATANASVKTLEDLIRFNKENEEKVMPHFKQEIFEQSQAMGDLSSKAYKDALKRLLTAARNNFATVFKKHSLTAVCGPANGPTWCIDLVNGDFFTGYGMYSPAAIAGYPSITVPMGMVEGLPVGLAFLGLAYSEPDLLGAAYSYEQVSKNRVAPSFDPKAVKS